ncbi:MAG: septum formation initiator family protein [Bacilli bacterium]|nr:septum formation initiator family protein [Bacilli bacterium]MDD3304670.1 septum formation initiator family protein [Bacilli bacterium]MDD4053278.1 septum formation initiator family protein [Bacilli bacterium]MDD4411382.1 septum formation initiator family protein [Bacilli bacterium]
MTKRKSVSKKVSKKTKRRLSLISLITIVVFSAFLFNVWNNFSQVISKKNEAKHLRSEISRLEDEEVHLKVEVEKLNDPEYVARYARERFLYSKEGEFTIKIPGTR